MHISYVINQVKNRLNMTLVNRIKQLEDAHRALHARHEALATMCRILLPLIGVSPSVMQQITTRAYDVMNELMDAHGFDAEFQSHARTAMDELTQTLVGK
jgi:hypothetical protein